MQAFADAARPVRRLGRNEATDACVKVRFCPRRGADEDFGSSPLLNKVGSMPPCSGLFYPRLFSADGNNPASDDNLSSFTECVHRST